MRTENSTESKLQKAHQLLSRVQRRKVQWPRAKADLQEHQLNAFEGNEVSETDQATAPSCCPGVSDISFQIIYDPSPELLASLNAPAANDGGSRQATPTPPPAKAKQIGDAADIATCIAGNGRHLRDQLRRNDREEALVTLALIERQCGHCREAIDPPPPAPAAPSPCPGQGTTTWKWVEPKATNPRSSKSRRPAAICSTRHTPWDQLSCCADRTARAPMPR